MKNKTVGFIGTGNMGAALARAVVRADYPICLYDKDSSKSKALADEIGGSALSLPELFDTCDYIFVGVKPNVLPILAEEVGAIAVKDGEIIARAYNLPSRMLPSQ